MVLTEEVARYQAQAELLGAAKIFDNFGAAALRIYLCSSPVVHAEKLNISEEDDLHVGPTTSLTTGSCRSCSRW